MTDPIRASRDRARGFRVAHISDLHVLALAGAVPFRLLNKRLTGYANLRLRRKHVHKTDVVRAILGHLRDADVDHVVVTGDVSNLALETEFEAVRELLVSGLGFPDDRVSIVPGNHDVYTGGSARSRRFFGFFERYLQSDLPDLATRHAAGPFPLVHLRGPAAIIGLASARPQLPFVAAGELGRAQLDALARVLAHPEVQARTPIVLIHHPLHNPPSFIKSALEGLRDADELMELLAPLGRGLVLHGHLHKRVRRRLATRTGHLDIVGATSASLIHEDPSKMGGYNLYDLGNDGAIVQISSQRLDTTTGAFHGVEIAEASPS